MREVIEFCERFNLFFGIQFVTKKPETIDEGEIPNHLYLDEVMLYAHSGEPMSNIELEYHKHNSLWPPLTFVDTDDDDDLMERLWNSCDEDFLKSFKPTKMLRFDEFNKVVFDINLQVNEVNDEI